MGLENILKMNWDNIRTIAQFDDRGFDTIEIDSSEQRQQQLHLNDGGDGNHNNNDLNPSLRFRNSITDIAESHPPASTSLLIESLIQLLCLILEDDPKLAEKSYKSICEQLNKINLIDNSYSMNEFEEMRSQYQMQIYKIICAVRGQDIPISLPNGGNINSNIGVNRSQSVETCWSRYHREFEEISFIAGGGFGKVFRARHKLDCIEYAVKQIKIHSTTIKLCHLAEVKTIASLNHPNIVQYKAAWLEPYLPKNGNFDKSQNSPLKISDIEAILSSETNDEDKSALLTASTNDSKTNSNSENSNGFDFNVKQEDNESSDFIQFEHSNNKSNSVELTKNEQQLTQQSKNSVSVTDNNNDRRAICKYSSNKRKITRTRTENFRTKPKLAILYIQMSLCQLTLRKWLNERNVCSTFEEYYVQFFDKRQELFNQYDIVNDIFCQILSGLNYIHSRNIVHHDIKPSNIFLGMENDGKLTAQLGDFGLACPLQNAHHGIALGTPLYAAPEQLKGECNPKSDIYSLGIVLLELLLKFNTDMERVRTIENARKGILPNELSKQSTKLLRSLLSHEKIRPNTKELMEAIRILNLEKNLRALNASQNDVKLKDHKINELKDELKLSNCKNVKNENEITNLLVEVDKRNKNIDELNKLLIEKNNEIIQLKQTIENLTKNNNITTKK